jgi:hypothetical protein
MVAEKPKILFQVDVDIDLANNPQIREMYKNNALGENMVMFLLKNKIDIVSTGVRAGGPVSHISLRGSPEGLQKFVDTYFTVDESPVVYNRLYI